jgi:hypothetical protein
VTTSPDAATTAGECTLLADHLKAIAEARVKAAGGNCLTAHVDDPTIGEMFATAEDLRRLAGHLAGAVPRAPG